MKYSKTKFLTFFAIGFLLTSAFSLNDAFTYDGTTITVVDNLEHDTTYGTFNSLVQVDADTYALAYEGANNDGFISTFTISADGSTITEVATLEHDTTLGTYNSLVQVDADTYALAYAGADNDGFISTFTISADGSTLTKVATLEHDTDNGTYNFLVQVDSNTYALAYTGANNDGFISTFTISADGSTITEVASLEHDTAKGQHNSLVQVDSDTYALAYGGGSGYSVAGFISTFTISADGSTITEVATLEHDITLGHDNSLVQVDADTYALAYRGANNDGFISTFTISADGSTITEVASLEHDTTYGLNNSLVQVDADTYALAYAGTDTDGFISTFTISADGSTITEVATLEHDASYGRYNSFVQVDADTYALAYEGAALDGFISTFTIDGSSSTFTEVESLEHDTTFGSNNSLVQVDSDTYALAYTDVDEDGLISTFTISADGSTLTEVATLEHDTTRGTSNSLIKVDADTYALAYEGPDFDGFISTFTISADGSTITEVATLEHDTAYGRSNSLVKVDADTYALAYEGPGFDGFISTFTISADGSTITEVATLEHDTTGGGYNSLVQVDSDTYALAYTGGTGGNYGFISTFTISADGSTLTEVATLEHDATRGTNNSLVKVDADTYALAYGGADEDGFISTFTISADGSTITEVASLEHDTTFGSSNSLVQVDSDTYALAYTGADGDGFISTFTISADGSTITEVESMEHDTTHGAFNSLVQVDADTYALAYGGPDSDGFISTFTIDGASASESESAATPTKKNSSDCYDCKPPTLQESHITILTNDYVVATGDDPLHITANVGDKVTILLNVTDNISVDTIPFAALYTNYQEKPSDMSAFYANNYDKWKHVSTSFYEWNVRSDDVAYDYDGTVSWSDNVPTVVTGEITDDNYSMINDNNVLEYFMMPFTFTINDFMEESTISAKIYDAAGNRLHVTLPVTLETAGNDPLNFDHMGKQKVLGFYNESVLSEMVQTWSESKSDAKQLSSLLGISEESLPAWSANLATWVAEDKIDSADLIVAVEYLINQ